jgi:hypothetical protein
MPIDQALYNVDELRLKLAPQWSQAMTSSKIRAMVILEGGIAQDILSDHAIEWDRFDWDDFSDDPVAYWGEMGQEWQDFFAQTAPEAYKQALETVEDARADEAKEEADHLLLNPFHDVPER